MVHARDSVCMGSTSQNSTGGAHVIKKITLRPPSQPPAGAARARAHMGGTTRKDMLTTDWDGLHGLACRY